MILFGFWVEVKPWFADRGLGTGFRTATLKSPSLAPHHRHLMDHEISLRDALSDDGDLELRFKGGQSIPVHSLKLKLASSVLKDLLTDVMDGQIASTHARKLLEASGSCERALPGLQVGARGQAQSCLSGSCLSGANGV